MSDPTDRAVLLGEHRRLISTLREFQMLEALPVPSDLGMDELRGLEAFLRQEVIPFARWEEEVLCSSPDEWEAAAFDHGFLTAEIDAFSSELDLLSDARDRGTLVLEPSAEEEGAYRAVQHIVRRLHRIEVVLELHVQRAEEWGIRVPGPETAGPPG